MAALWIIHRDESLRRALARLAGSSEQPTLGAPGDAFLEEAPAPDVVLLGLAGDLERELEFVHRLAARQPHAGWILVGESGDLERARRLFDSLPGCFLTYPPDPGALRAALRAAAARPHADPLPLSQRPARDALTERFARGFSDLELPQLMRALDPRMGGVPVLVVGEAGTGRGTLARYLHHFGALAEGALLELRCEPGTRAEDLVAAMSGARLNPRSLRACTLWLADVEQLSAGLQREMAGWIHFGPPQGTLCTDAVRWVGTATDQGLEPELRRVLGALTIRVPPLRARPELLTNLANETVRAWCASRGLPTRRLGEDALSALEEYPWPGNIRELEAVLEQSLAASSADPLGPEDLVLDGEAFAPLDGAFLDAGLPLGEPARSEPPPPLRRLPSVEAVPALDSELALETLTALDEVEPAELLDDEAEVLDDDEARPLDEGETDVLDADEAELMDSSKRPGRPHGRPGKSRGRPEADAEPRPRVPSASSPGELTRLAAAVGHELRNPLTAVRALAELLPDHHADPEFRARFASLAGAGLSRVEEALERLDRLAAFPPPEPQAIDVGGLLEEVLDKRRGRIHERRLLVLEELDRGRPRALADPEQLRFVFEALLDAAIDLVPERGHVYIASKRNTSGLRSGPSVRVLIRYRGPQMGPSGPQRTDLAPAANALNVALAEIVTRSQRGTLALDTSDRSETVIVVDLPS